MSDLIMTSIKYECPYCGKDVVDGVNPYELDKLREIEMANHFSAVCNAIYNLSPIGSLPEV